jgi:hypothetical protein
MPTIPISPPILSIQSINLQQKLINLSPVFSVLKKEKEKHQRKREIESCPAIKLSRLSPLINHHRRATRPLMVDPTASAASSRRRHQSPVHISPSP